MEMRRVVEVTGAGNTAGAGTCLWQRAGAGPRRDPLDPRLVRATVGDRRRRSRGERPGIVRHEGVVDPGQHPVGHASGVLRTRRRMVARGQERLDRRLCGTVALVGEREHLAAVSRSGGIAAACDM